jgi:hypothetical protein
MNHDVGLAPRSRCPGPGYARPGGDRARFAALAETRRGAWAISAGTMASRVSIVSHGPVYASVSCMMGRASWGGFGGGRTAAARGVRFGMPHGFALAGARLSGSSSRCMGSCRCAAGMAPGQRTIAMMARRLNWCMGFWRGSAFPGWPKDQLSRCMGSCRCAAAMAPGQRMIAMMARCLNWCMDLSPLRSSGKLLWVGFCRCWRCWPALWRAPRRCRARCAGTTRRISRMWPSGGEKSAAARSS